MLGLSKPNSNAMKRSLVMGPPKSGIRKAKPKEWRLLVGLFFDLFIYIYIYKYIYIYIFKVGNNHCNHLTPDKPRAKTFVNKVLCQIQV